MEPDWVDYDFHIAPEDFEETPDYLAWLEDTWNHTG